MYQPLAENAIEKIMGTTKLYTTTVTLPNGQRKYIRAKTKAELNKKKDEIKSQIGMGIAVGNDTTVAQIAQTWFNVYKKPYIREGGKESIKYVVNNWILPQIGQMKVADVKTVHIRNIMASQEGLSDSLQKKTLQALKGIFLCAEESHLIAKSPITPSIKANGKTAEKKVPLTTEQCRQLLQATKGTRAYIAVAVMLGAGLRREEVCGLMWSDIDFDSGTLTVNRAQTFYKGRRTLSNELKSEAAHRTIPLPKWLTDDLRASESASSSLYVLHGKNGEPVTESSFKRLWGLIEARTTDSPALLGKSVDAKHPDVRYGIDFHVHPHLLRHTCITKWIEAGLDVKTVQYLAGHANPEITLRIYAHYLEEERRADTAEKIQNSPILSAVSFA